MLPVKICAEQVPPEEVNILIRQLPEFSLGKDTTLDLQEKVSFEFETPYLRYEWNTGTTSPKVELQGIDLGSGKHTIWLMVTDTNNCTNTDTLGNNGSVSDHCAGYGIGQKCYGLSKPRFGEIYRQTNTIMKEKR